MRGGTPNMALLNDGRVIDYAPLCWQPADDPKTILQRTALWIAFDADELDADELSMEYAEFHPQRGWVLIGGHGRAGGTIQADRVHYWAIPPKTPPRRSGGKPVARPEPEPVDLASA